MTVSITLFQCTWPWGQLTENAAIKHQEVSLLVLLIRDQTKFKDLLYLIYHVSFIFDDVIIEQKNFLS